MILNDDLEEVNECNVLTAVLKILGPVNFPVIRTMGQAGEGKIS